MSDMSETSDGQSAGAKPKGEGRPFDEVMSELEQLVVRLEDGELGLEESLSVYEAGVALLRQAQSRLSEMDRRLKILLPDGTLGAFEESGKRESPAGDEPGPTDGDTA